MSNLSWRIEELRSSRSASREDYPITVYELRKLLDILDDIVGKESTTDPICKDAEEAKRIVDRRYGAK